MTQNNKPSLREQIIRALEYSKSIEITPDKPYFQLASASPKENIEYLLGLLKFRINDNEQKLKIYQSINYFNAEIEKQPKAVNLVTQKQIFITDDNLEKIKNLIDRYNKAAGVTKFQVFRELFNFLEAEIDSNNSFNPDLQEALSEIIEQDVFKRTIKGLGYGRGGAMHFPNFLLKHLD